MHSFSREPAFRQHVSTMLAGDNKRVDAMIQAPCACQNRLSSGYRTSRKRILYTAMYNDMTRMPGNTSMTRRMPGVGEVARTHRLKIVHSHYCRNAMGY